jgi:hypothetical protein
MKKTLLIILFIFFLIGSYYILLFNYSNVFFPKKVQKGNLTFYYQQEFSSDTFCFVDKANELAFKCKKIDECLKTSILYDSTTFEGHVFLTDNDFLINSFAFFRPHHSAFCLWKLDGRVIIKKHEVCERMFEEASSLIAHELVHVLEVGYLGKQQYKETPKWLLEGYAAYIAQNGNVNLIFEPSNEGEYDKYLLVVGYLLQERKYKEKQLFATPPDYEETLNEIQHWRKNKRQAK